MKLRIFLSLTSFWLIIFNTYSETYPANLLWGKAKLNNTNTESVLITNDEDNFFISYNIESLKLDLENDNFYFKFKLSDLNSLQGLEIRFSEKKNAQSYLSYTLPYFSDPEFNPFKAAEWAEYGISKANLVKVKEGAGKIKFVSFFLFTNKKSLIFSLKDFSKKEKPKQGIVSITFDDGYISQLLAGKIAHQNGLKGTAYVMPRNIGQKGLMSTTDMLKLKELGWDIQSHHEIPFTQMSTDVLNTELKFGLDYLKKNKLFGPSQHLAYPLGKHNELIVSIIKNYFKTARLAGGGIETIPPADLYRLKVYNILRSTTIEDLKKVIDSTNQNHQWLILMLHYLKEKPKNDLEYKPEDFKKLCEYLKESKANVMTIDEVYNKYLK